MKTKWTFLKEVEPKIFANAKARMILCRCSCGTKKIICRSSFLNKKTLSCGCYQKQVASKSQTKHGKSKEKIYFLWKGLISRCRDKNRSDYKYYGGKGIKVCNKWKSFQSFYSDMGEPPFVGASIDRINGSKGYSKENCRWATKSQQMKNRSKLKRNKANGRFQ